MRKKFKLFGRSVNLLIIKEPENPTVGVENELEDCFYVPFMDYDNVDYKKVMKELLFLNQAFGLCRFVVLCGDEDKVKDLNGDIKTIGSYNVIGIDRLTFKQHMKMLSFLRVDYNFKKIVKWYSQRNWVLRIFGKYEKDGINEYKPVQKVKEVIVFDCKCSKYMHSSAFIQLLKNQFDVDFTHVKNQDNLYKFTLVNYHTRKKGGSKWKNLKNRVLKKKKSTHQPLSRGISLSEAFGAVSGGTLR